jgi:hypothetical protein
MPRPRPRPALRLPSQNAKRLSGGLLSIPDLWDHGPGASRLLGPSVAIPNKVVVSFGITSVSRHLTSDTEQFAHQQWPR